MLTAKEALANKIREQGFAKEAWHDNNGIGTLEEATGFGKSKVAIDIIEDCRHIFLQANRGDLRVLLVVPTEEMRDVDWPAEFEKWGVSMDGIKSVCYASVSKQKLEKYDLIIYDEYHKLTLKNLEKLQVRMEQPVFVLSLTATLPHKGYEPEDLERIKLMKELVPSVHKTTTDQAVELGLVADFEIKVLKHFADNTNKNILAGSKLKPFYNTEVGQYKWLTKKMGMAMARANGNPKMKGFMFKTITERAQFLYNLPSKTRLAKQVLDSIMKDGKRTVVFAGGIEQADTLCGVNNVYHSKSSRDALERFQTKESNILGAVRALNEGKNLTEPEQSLIIQVDSVDRNLIQRIGRLIRIRYDNMGFKARIIILVTAGTQDEKWYNMAIADFETSRISEHFVKTPPIENAA